MGLSWVIAVFISFHLALLVLKDLCIRFRICSWEQSLGSLWETNTVLCMMLVRELFLLL